jgi:hypothetical protein
MKYEDFLSNQSTFSTNLKIVLLKYAVSSFVITDDFYMLFDLNLKNMLQCVP